MKKYVKILSALVFAVTLFTGCENFLGGTDLSEEVGDLIADLNAEKQFITVRAEEGQGETTPNG